MASEIKNEELGILEPEEQPSLNLPAPVDQTNYVPWKPNKQQWLIFACLALLSFIISLDTTIITPAIPVSTPSFFFLSFLS